MNYFFLFLLGLCVGSFLNCLVYRLNLTSQESRSLPRHLRSVLLGRSVCPRCKHKLAWWDNIPLLSFVLLQGKCRYCQSPISWHYPLVELVSGILTVFVFQLSSYELRVTSYNLLITYVLIAIFVSDFLYETIPDQIVLPTLLITLIFLIFQFPNVFISNLIVALMTVGFFYLLVLITRGRGMGLGDVKLGALMGLFLGWPKILVALYLAFLTGAVMGVILILLKKKKFDQHIPFGPFLSGGSFIAWFWGEKIWQEIIKALL